MSENLGLELKNYREAHSLTQMDVALLLDCSGDSVSVWERGAPMLGLSGVAVRTLLSLNDPYKVLQAGAPALEAELTRLRGENAKQAKELDLWKAGYQRAKAREDKVRGMISTLSRWMLEDLRSD